jgi:AcrR family transcriptional regulator
MTGAQRSRSADPRPARTRKLLIEAAQQLLAEQSLDALTIDDIVTAAQVGRGSFYNHFQDKEALGAEIAFGIRDHLDAEIHRINIGIDDPAERLMRAFFASVSYARSFPQNAQIIVNLQLTSTDPQAPINAKMVADLKLGLASGAFDVPSLDIGVSVVVALISIGIRHVLEGMAEDGCYLTELAARMVMALGVERQRAIELVGRIGATFPGL